MLEWIRLVQEHLCVAPSILVGTQSDRLMQRFGLQEEAAKFAAVNNMDYIEVSAKTEWLLMN
jgi:hypothetical protein